MRIIPIPLSVEALEESTRAAPAAAPAAPTVSPERLETLEKTLRALQEDFRKVQFTLQELQSDSPSYERILQALHKMEERLSALEPAKEEAAAPVHVPSGVQSAVIAPTPTIELDPEAVKTQLLAKMWKYLNTKE